MIEYVLEGGNQFMHREKKNMFFSLSDRELCERIRGGESQAFWQLAERYMSFIRAKAVRFRSGVLDEEDLVQEGLLGLLSAARYYRQDKKAEFSTFADVCIRNRMITALRRAERERGLSGVPLSINQDEGIHNLPAGAGADPEALLDDSEACEELLQKIMQTLSVIEREVVLLRLKGCGYSEIARTMQTTEKAVDNALQRARGKLKRFFSK